MPATPTLAGDEPQRYISPLTLGRCRHTKVRKLGAWVDGRVQVSSVPATVPLAGDEPQPTISRSTLGRCRHTKVRKLGAWVDGRVQVSSVPATPPLAGDKPQPYISPSTLCWCRHQQRVENWVYGLMEGFRCRLCTSPFPWLGASPSATSVLRPSAYSSTTRRFISWIRGGNLSRTLRFIDGQWPPPVPCSSQAAW